VRDWKREKEKARLMVELGCSVVAWLRFSLILRRQQTNPLLYKYLDAIEWKITVWDLLPGRKPAITVFTGNQPVPSFLFLQSPHLKVLAANCFV